MSTPRLTATEAARLAAAPVRLPKPPAPEPPPRHWCPDCGWMPVPPPRPGKDGRCIHCRGLVGRHRRDHSAPPQPPVLDRFREDT